MLYITSDPHLNHKNLCRATSGWEDKSNTRDFASLEDMNNAFLDACNKRVGKDDELIIAGDVIFGDKNLLPSFLSQIRCRNIHLVYGNHDECIAGTKKFSKGKGLERAIKFQKLFASTQYFMQFRHKGVLVNIFHYPMLIWEENGKGAINLFGHCHGTLKNPIGRQIDVGFDCYPSILSMDEAVYICRSKEIVALDHHDHNTNYGGQHASF